MRNNEKAARIIERLREIEVLSAPRPFAQQLEAWDSADTWAEDLKSEVAELIAMLDSLIREVENGS
jgi:hypothetical protein